MSKTPPKNCLDFCQQNSQLTNLFRSAKRHLQCTVILNTLLPPALAKQCQVAQIDQFGTLILFAHTGTVAKKMQWLAVDWPNIFTQQGLNINAVKVSVLPHIAPQSIHQSPIKASQAVIEQLIQTANMQSDTALSLTLIKLAYHLKDHPY